MDRPISMVELRVIARGAEADIVEAEWMGTRVILKRRPPKGYLNPELDARVRRSRTIREAQMMHEAKLLGVPTPALHFVDPLGSEIIMEFLEGPRLKELLDSGGGLDLMRLVGEYLGRLHSGGIVHGDPTTSNFLLSGGVLYLVDFGLSFRSRSPRDQASDLHVLEEALRSYHSDVADEALRLFGEGYHRAFGGAAAVMRWLRRIESSGRYKGP